MDLIERLRLLEQDHEPDGWPAVRMRDITAILDALEAARESLDREAALKGGVEHQRDTLWAELEAAREDGWQPIESAPRDGRQMILLLTPSRFPQVAFSNTWWTAGFSVECKPTHWRRIEPLPAIDQARGKGVADA